MAKHATTMEMIKINEILKQVLVVHEGGLCSYIPGYNDEKVAMEVGSHLSKHSVMGVRTKIYGILRNKTGTSEKDASEEVDIKRKISEVVQIAKNAEQLAKSTVEIEARLGEHIDNINRLAGDLDQRFDKLVALLALNRVVDCRHLGTPHKNGDKK